MLSKIESNLSAKLRDRNYRHKFFKGRADDEIASHLLEFRKKRSLSQTALAKLCGMKQSAISRIEKSSYSRWTFTTLWRVAKALDVRVEVIFTDMADVIAEYERREQGVSPTTASITNEVVPGVLETVISVGEQASRLGSGDARGFMLPPGIEVVMTQSLLPQTFGMIYKTILNQDAVSASTNAVPS